MVLISLNNSTPNADPFSNEGLRAAVDENKLKELQEKYLRPENIDNLQVPLVDNTLWRQLLRELRARDVQYQKEAH